MNISPLIVSLQTLAKAAEASEHRLHFITTETETILKTMSTCLSRHRSMLQKSNPFSLDSQQNPHASPPAQPSDSLPPVKDDSLSSNNNNNVNSTAQNAYTNNQSGIRNPLPTENLSSATPSRAVSFTPSVSNNNNNLPSSPNAVNHTKTPTIIIVSSSNSPELDKSNTQNNNNVSNVSSTLCAALDMESIQLYPIFTEETIGAPPRRPLDFHNFKNSCSNLNHTSSSTSLDPSPQVDTVVASIVLSSILGRTLKKLYVDLVTHGRSHILLADCVSCRVSVIPQFASTCPQLPPPEWKLTRAEMEEIPSTDSTPLASRLKMGLACIMQDLAPKSASSPLLFNDLHANSQLIYLLAPSDVVQKQLPVDASAAVRRVCDAAYPFAAIADLSLSLSMVPSHVLAIGKHLERCGVACLVETPRDDYKFAVHPSILPVHGGTEETSRTSTSYNGCGFHDAAAIFGRSMGYSSPSVLWGSDNDAQSDGDETILWWRWHGETRRRWLHLASEFAATFQVLPGTVIGSQLHDQTVRGSSGGVGVKDLNLTGGRGGISAVQQVLAQHHHASLPSIAMSQAQTTLLHRSTNSLSVSTNAVPANSGMASQFHAAHSPSPNMHAESNLQNSSNYQTATWSVHIDSTAPLQSSFINNPVWGATIQDPHSYKEAIKAADILFESFSSGADISSFTSVSYSNNQSNVNNQSSHNVLNLSNNDTTTHQATPSNSISTEIVFISSRSNLSLPKFLEFFSSGKSYSMAINAFFDFMFPEIHQISSQRVNNAHTHLQTGSSATLANAGGHINALSSSNLTKDLNYDQLNNSFPNNGILQSGHFSTVSQNQNSFSNLLNAFNNSGNLQMVNSQNFNHITNLIRKSESGVLGLNKEELNSNNNSINISSSTIVNHNTNINNLNHGAASVAVSPVTQKDPAFTFPITSMHHNPNNVNNNSSTAMNKSITSLPQLFMTIQQQNIVPTSQFSSQKVLSGHQPQGTTTSSLVSLSKLKLPFPSMGERSQAAFGQGPFHVQRDISYSTSHAHGSETAGDATSMHVSSALPIDTHTVKELQELFLHMYLWCVARGLLAKVITTIAYLPPPCLLNPVINANLIVLQRLEDKRMREINAVESEMMDNRNLGPNQYADYLYEVDQNNYENTSFHNEYETNESLNDATGSQLRSSKRNAKLGFDIQPMHVPRKKTAGNLRASVSLPNIFVSQSSTNELHTSVNSNSNKPNSFLFDENSENKKLTRSNSSNLLFAALACDETPASAAKKVIEFTEVILNAAVNSNFFIDHTTERTIDIAVNRLSKISLLQQQQQNQMGAAFNSSSLLFSNHNQHHSTGNLSKMSNIPQSGVFSSMSESSAVSPLFGHSLFTPPAPHMGFYHKSNVLGELTKLWRRRKELVLGKDLKNALIQQGCELAQFWTHAEVHHLAIHCIQNASALNAKSFNGGNSDSNNGGIGLGENGPVSESYNLHGSYNSVHTATAIPHNITSSSSIFNLYNNNSHQKTFNNIANNNSYQNLNYNGSLGSIASSRNAGNQFNETSHPVPPNPTIYNNNNGNNSNNNHSNSARTNLSSDNIYLLHDLSFLMRVVAVFLVRGPLSVQSEIEPVVAHSMILWNSLLASNANDPASNSSAPLLSSSANTNANLSTRIVESMGSPELDALLELWEVSRMQQVRAGLRDELRCLEILVTDGGQNSWDSRKGVFVKYHVSRSRNILMAEGIESIIHQT